MREILVDLLAQNNLGAPATDHVAFLQDSTAMKETNMKTI